MPIIPAAGAGAIHGAVVPIVTYSPIALSEVLTFSNIPQIYQDLMLVMHSVNTAGGGFAGSILDNFNADANLIANRSNTVMYGYANNGSSSFYNASSSSVPQVLGGTLPSQFPLVSVIHIMNYRNTASCKTILQRSAIDQGGTSIGHVNLSVGAYNITAPITQFNVSSQTVGSYLALGSRFSLYGVRSINQ